MAVSQESDVLEIVRKLDMAGAVWLLRSGKRYVSLVAILPGMFMTTVVVSFILWTPGTGGQPWGLVPGGLPLAVSMMFGGAVALVFAWYARLCGRSN